MHRTTIELDEPLLKNLKGICIKEKKTFKKLVLELVRNGLEFRQKSKAIRPIHFEQWAVSRRALPPGIDPSDRSTYSHLIHRTHP